VARLPHRVRLRLYLRHAHWRHPARARPVCGESG
jgi:hypothetical protein